MNIKNPIEGHAHSAITPGNSFRIYYGKQNFNNKLIHVRSIVDDYVVFRIWFKRKKYWSYQIEPLYYFQILIDKKVLFKAE